MKKGPARTSCRGTGDLRRRLSVRARAARLSAGRRLRARGRARLSRAGREPASRLSARRLRRDRGLHLLCAPREAAADRARERSRADEPAGAGDRQEGRGRGRRAGCRQHLQHQHLRAEQQGRGAPGARDVRGAGRLGGRRRCRFHRGGDDFMARRGRDRARRDQADQAALGRDLRAAPAGRDARQGQRAGSREEDRAARRRRRRPQLHPRHPHHDALRAGRSAMR